MAIREGRARSVMNSYADVDGVPAAADESLLTGILREEWGFDGVVVSDYWAISFLRSMHRVAGSNQEAGALALTAGIDVELPDTNCFNTDLLELIRSGSLAEALVGPLGASSAPAEARARPARPGLDGRSFRG